MTFNAQRKADDDALALGALAEIEDTIDGAFAELAAGRDSYQLFKKTVESVAGILARAFDEMERESPLGEYESWGLAQEPPLSE